MKIRFSIRSLLILFTVATIVCGYRYNQRKNLEFAAAELQENGATVFYHWQSPYIVKIPVQVSPQAYAVEVPYTETLPNGERVTKYRIEFSGRNPSVAVISEEYYVGFTENRKARISEPPGFSLSAFFLGSHDDVDVAGVSIKAMDVDENVIKQLQRLNHLETVILRVGRDYFRVESSRPRTEQNEKAKKSLLDKLGRDLERATKLLKEDLPDVELHRGMTRVSY